MTASRKFLLPKLSLVFYWSYCMKPFFQGRILLWCLVILASIVVNLKNIRQRITEILPFYLNHDFSQFPNFIKMLQPTCDYGKMEINNVQLSFGMCTILSSELSELSTNHVGIKRDGCILSVTFPKIEFLTCRLYANAFHLLLFGFEHFWSMIIILSKRKQPIFAQRLDDIANFLSC